MGNLYVIRSYEAVHNTKRCQITIKLVFSQPLDSLDLLEQFVSLRLDFDIPWGFASLTAIDFFLGDARSRGREESGLLTFEGMRNEGYKVVALHFVLRICQIEVVY